MVKEDYPCFKRVQDFYYTAMSGASSPTGPGPRDSHLLVKQIGAAFFFGISSILIVVVNKIVLTTYKFPSYHILGLGQMVAIIVVIGVAKAIGMVKFPNPSFAQVQKVWPLPLFYILNLVFGLGSTKKLNLPMFTVLRRFSLFFMGIGQVYVLNQYESKNVNVTLIFMVGGALIAALNDLAFDLSGYIFVLINNLTTAASVVYSKKMLNTEVTKLELLFYNALISFIPACLLACLSGDVDKAYYFEGWSDYVFVLLFSLSCMLGFFLMYSTVLVNQLTSPLTLAVTGCMKNLLVTYCGMLIGGDYVFDEKNFIGINISVAASMAYSYFKFVEGSRKQPAQSMLPSPTNPKTERTEVA